LPHQDRLNIAVFIDFDNIEIGVKTTLNEHFDVGTILDAIKERGEVVTKIAYADWTRAGEYSRSLTQHAIRLVQRNLTPGGDKNGADINLALDALEMAFTHPHINAYVIVGGDSDFLSLVEKLKQYDKKVFVVGGRAFTSIILQRNCHEFIAYENLVGGRRSVQKGGQKPAPTASPIAQAIPVVRRALKILADREVSPQTGLLKSTLLQLDSTFSERNYGASSFLDFVEKLAETHLVRLKHAGRSVMVELNEVYREDGEASARGAADAMAADAEPPRTTEPTEDAQPTATQSPVAAPPESAAEGVRRVGQLLSSATSARWPMYVRNVKQVLRNADRSFDERKYGFAGLVDLLRACQREGIVRLERDRRGGLRVFAGPALTRVVPFEPRPQPDVTEVEEIAAAAPSVATEALSEETSAAMDGNADHVAVAADQPVVVKPKRSRSRNAAAGARKSGARKAAAPRRAARVKRTAPDKADIVE